MRGTCVPVLAVGRTEGLIPAGAGNMSISSFSRMWNRAHPRGCGEHAVVETRAGYEGGSSPRVRGTLSVPFTAFPSGGLIPAGAGNISTKGTSIERFSAHPRGCGEHG